MEKWKKSRSWQRTSAVILAACLVLIPTAAQAAELTEVIPIGRAAGIKMTANGVMVVKISAVQTAVGEVYPAKQAGLHEGDIIISANNAPIDSNESLKQAVADAADNALTLSVLHNGTQASLTVHAVADATGEKRIGVMVRDSIAGIGTITYVDPTTGAYGSLGHGICDTATGVLLPLASGNVMEASVSKVQKGAAGEPGALQGEFNLQQDMGTVTQNTSSGIFGTLTDNSYYKSLSTVPVADEKEVQLGKAQILSNVNEEESRLYDVEIDKIFDDKDDLGRGMLLRVTDEALLAQTGGIVQGMSGSPVMQNGKIIGAVTHVLVNDPTRGYAVFIHKMMGEMHD